MRAVEGVDCTKTPAALILGGIAIAEFPWLFDLAAFCTEQNDLGRGRHSMMETASPQRTEVPDFECQAVVANATAAGYCALACQRTQHINGRRRTASHKAMASSTWA